MAHHKSAIKRIRTSHKANERNRHYRSMMRSAIRRVRETADSENKNENLHKACVILDRLVSKGVLHRNTAARRKSRLNKLVNARNPVI